MSNLGEESSRKRGRSVNVTASQPSIMSAFKKAKTVNDAPNDPDVVDDDDPESEFEGMIDDEELFFIESAQNSASQVDGRQAERGQPTFIDLNTPPQPTPPLTSLFRLDSYSNMSVLLSTWIRSNPSPTTLHKEIFFQILRQALEERNLELVSLLIQRLGSLSQYSPPWTILRSAVIARLQEEIIRIYGFPLKI